MVGVLLGRLFDPFDVVPNPIGRIEPCCGAEPNPCLAKNATHPQGISNLEVRSCIGGDASGWSTRRSREAEGSAPVPAGSKSLEVQSSLATGSRFQHDLCSGEHGHCREHRWREYTLHSQLDRCIGGGGNLRLCVHVAGKSPRRFGTNDGHASGPGRYRTLGDTGRSSNHSKGNGREFTDDR